MSWLFSLAGAVLQVIGIFVGSFLMLTGGGVVLISMLVSAANSGLPRRPDNTLAWSGFGLGAGGLLLIILSSAWF